MRRTNLVLLALAQLCAAKQTGFSIHEDLLAHPQFEVVFSETYVLEKDAQLLIEGAARSKPSAIPNADTIAGTTHTDTDADAVAPHDSTASLAVEKHTNDADGKTPPAIPGHAAADNDYSTADDGSEQISETFELINVPPLQYLCSIPVLSPPPGATNETATNLARAAEARELARASDRGAEILDTLEGECMFHVFGWWSYSFCYGQEVVQFHTVPGKNGKAMKDPHSPEFVLGRMKSKQEREDPLAAEAGESHNIRVGGDVVEVQKPMGTTPDDVPKNSNNNNNKKKKLDVHKTEIQIKGDQKYMVQRLGDGTVCDLTGRDRTLEIQYHCNPGATSDRISWIKEVTTCSYLMEVRTPRLCEEPAFLPPKPKHAHPISCRLVVHSEDELARWHEQKTIEAREAMSGGKQPTTTEAGADEEEVKDNRVVIGGIAVGARRIFAEEVRDAADAVPALQNTKTAKAASKALNKGRLAGAGAGVGGDKAREALHKARAKKEEANKFLGVIARGEGNDESGNAGVIEVLDAEELQQLGVNAAAIAELIVKMGVLANGKPWHVSAYATTGDASPVLKAYIDSDDGETDAEGAGINEAPQEEAKEADRPTIKVVLQKIGTDDAPAAVAGSTDEGSTEESRTDDGSSDEGSTNEGSEETFKKDEKDEL